MDFGDEEGEEKRRGPALPRELLAGPTGAAASAPSAGGMAAPAPVVGERVATTYTGDAAVADPLKMLAKEKKEASPQEGGDGSPAKPASRAEELEAFMAGQLPMVRSGTAGGAPAAASGDAAGAAVGEAPSEGPPPKLRAAIISRQEIDGVTWYNIKVTNGPVEQAYQKRYSDFKEFDKSLRDRSALFQKLLPELPEKGLVGLRHRFDMGDFNEKRQEGLQRWLDVLCQNVNQRAVMDFFDAERVIKEVRSG